MKSVSYFLRLSIYSSLFIATQSFAEQRYCSVQEVDLWWTNEHGQPPAHFEPTPDATTCATPDGVSDRFVEIGDDLFDREPAAHVLPHLTPGNDPTDEIAEAVSEQGAYWVPGETLKVCFINGPKNLRTLIEKVVANSWEIYANFKFEFDKANCGPAGHDIRISLNQTKRSWSCVGTTSRYWASQGKPTMEFGWLADTTYPKADQIGTIIHEFGHALGLHHEHQNPNIKIEYDLYKTYIYYAGTNSWCPETTYSNVLATNLSGVDATLWDSQSVMHYPVRKELTRNNISVSRNSTLSEGDKMWAAVAYPSGERSRAKAWRLYSSYAKKMNKLPSYWEILAMEVENAPYPIEQTIGPEQTSGGCSDCGFVMDVREIKVRDDKQEIASIDAFTELTNSEGANSEVVFDVDGMPIEGTGPEECQIIGVQNCKHYSDFEFVATKKVWVDEHPSMNFEDGAKTRKVYLVIRYKDGRNDRVVPYNYISTSVYYSMSSNDLTYLYP